MYFLTSAVASATTNPAVSYFLTTLPHFLLYFSVAVALAVSFLVAYVTITPLKEFALIGEGKTAPALSLIGSFLGFVVPLSVVIGHSVSVLDMVLWGVVVLAVQALVFAVISKVLFKTIAQRITDNCNASGLFLGGMSLGIGVLTAACMVP